MDTPDLPPERSAPPPIPSLELLGDRLEVAAARSIEGRTAGARRGSGSLLAGGRGPWRLALIPAVGVAAVVALLVVVFVNGGTTPLPAEAAMLQAADRTAALPTGRFSMTIQVGAGVGLSSTIGLAGAYDESNGRLRAEADLSSIARGIGGGSNPLGDATKMEVVVDRGTGYLKSVILQTMLGSTTPWFRLDAAVLSAMFGGAAASSSGPRATGSVPSGAVADSGGISSALPLATDPSVLLDLVRHAGGQVAFVGTERIDGADTSHYRAITRLAAAVAQLDAEGQENMRSLLAAVGDHVQDVEVPIDVWVGADGLVRRVVMGVSPARAGSASLTVDYLDPGLPVEITVPEGANTDLGPLIESELSRILGGGLVPSMPKQAPTTTR